MSSGSCDPLPRESTCKIVWSEEKSKIPPSLSNIANSPPEKRRRLELLVSAMDSRNETTESQFHIIEPVEPGTSFCLMLVTDEGIPGSEVVVVGLWRKEGMDEMQTEELTRVKLTSKLICSGELSIDHRCLGLWNGESILPLPSSLCEDIMISMEGSASLSGEGKFHSKETQDLACFLASHSLIQVSVFPSECTACALY